MALRFKNRKLVLILAPLALLALVAASLMAIPSSGTITRANFDKIEPGTTTIQQARDLLRGEHVSEVVFDDYVSGDTGLCFREGASPDSQFIPFCEIWVVLDYDRISKKSFHQPTVADVIEWMVYRIKLPLAR